MTFVLYLYLLLIIGAIFFVIFIYRIIYKQNMNRALHGEGTSGLIDIGSLLKTIAIIALIVMNIVTLTKLDDLRYKMNTIESNLINQINSLKSTVSSMRHEIEEYYDSLELIQRKEKTLVDVNLEDDIYTYDIEFTILEKPEVNADVYLVVEKEGVSEKFLLTSVSLTFKYQLELDYDTEIYEVSVMIEGTSVIQKHLFDINVDYDSNYIFKVGFDILESPSSFAIISYVSQDISFVDNLQVSSVKFTFVEDGVPTESKTTSTIADISSLVAQYENDSIQREFPAGNLFAVVHEVNDDFKGELEIQIEITLSNGTVIQRVIEF